MMSGRTAGRGLHRRGAPMGEGLIGIRSRLHRHHHWQPRRALPSRHGRGQARLRSLGREARAFFAASQECYRPWFAQGKVHDGGGGRGVKGDVRENICGEDAVHSFPAVQQSCYSRTVRLCDQSRRAEDFTWQLTPFGGLVFIGRSVNTGPLLYVCAKQQVHARESNTLETHVDEKTQRKQKSGQPQHTNTKQKRNKKKTT